MLSECWYKVSLDLPKILPKPKILWFIFFLFNVRRLQNFQSFNEVVFEEVFGGFFALKDSTNLNIFLSQAALSWLGNDLGNCPASVSHSNSPSQIHGIIFGQSNVSHCCLRRVQTGPPNGSHFYLFLKIQRLLKEQLDKVEDWRSLIFLFQ